MEYIKLIDKNILIIDPNYGAGISQASIYLYDYVRNNNKNTKMIKLIEGNDSPAVFSVLYNIYETFKPDLVLIHEYNDLIPFSILKFLFPNVSVALLSLGKLSIKEAKVGCTIDYFVSPLSNKFPVRHNTLISKYENIQWMFDMPDRYYDVYEEEEKRRSGIIYSGRLIESKFSAKFAKLSEEAELPINLYGEFDAKDNGFDYRREIEKRKNLFMRGTVENMNMEKVYKNYSIAVLPSTTDCFCLFIVEAILTGCYPVVMLERPRDRFAWMDVNFPIHENEECMIAAIKEFLLLDKKEQREKQAIIRASVVEFLKEASNIETLKDIASREPLNRQYYSRINIDDVVEWGGKYNR